MPDPQIPVTPIAGYREQSQTALAAVNENKMLEEMVLQRLDLLQSMDDVDKRWAAIARTEIEKGFMALNRAVMQPARVELPGHAVVEPKSA